MRKSKALVYDTGALTREYPSLKTLAGPTGKARCAAWVSAFTHRPETLEKMISDLIKQVYAKPGRIGQRPMPKEIDVDFQALLNGEYTDLPMTEVLPELIGDVSEVVFATQIWVSRRTCQRMFLPDGDPLKHWPTMDEIERIAVVVGKPPSFFLEYRLIAAQAAFLNLITDRPVVATRIYREYLQVAKQSPMRKTRTAS
jgi:hypothetical protein